MTKSRAQADCDLFEQAEVAFENGDFESARDLYGEVLRDQLPSSLSLSSLSAVALERLADIAYLFGEPEKAEQILAEIRDHFNQSGRVYEADFISLKLASIATTRGLFYVARKTLTSLTARPEAKFYEFETELEEQSFHSWEANWKWPNTSADLHSTFLSNFYLVAGRIAAGEGQYGRAIALLKRGLLHTYRDGAAQESELPLMLCLAAAHLERGDLLSASLTLKTLPGTITEARYRGYGVQAIELQARVELLRGDLGPAKARLERVLQLCSSGNFEHADARASLNLAYVLIFLNQTARATEICQRVKEFAVDRDEALATRAQFLIRFAAERGQSLVSGVAIAYSVTEMQDAAASSEKVDQIRATLNPFELPRSPNFLTLFEDRALGFYWHLGRCDWKAARSYLQEMEVSFLGSDPPTDSLLIHQRLAALDCMLAYYEGNFELARDGFEQVIEITKKMDLKPELWQYLCFLGWCHARLNDVSESERITREANAINQTLSSTLNGSDRAIYQFNKWTQSETYLAGELNELARMKRAIYSAKGIRKLYRPWQRIKLMLRLAALLDQLDSYKAGIMQRTVENDGDSWRGTKRSGFAMVRRLFRHPRRQNTVSFLVLPDRTLVARIGWMCLDFALVGVTRLQLRELTSKYHQALAADRKINASRALKGISEALQLPALLATLPARIDSLRFVPDDILHGVPFAAIQYEHDSAGSDSASSPARRYLVEDYAVTVSNEWLPKVCSPSTATGVLAVSVPHGTAQLDPLPGADDEREQVIKWFTSMGIAAIDAEAKKVSILAHLPQARFFHIACHGEFCPDAPSDSGLLIVSPNGEVKRISLLELSQLDLSGLEMAILSSCWSADNFILPGRWIISLPETFLRAGTHTVVGSLWPLDDELAVPFMDKLYKELASGAPRAEALRQVQVACIRGEFGNEFRDPSYWAAIVLHGDTQPLLPGFSVAPRRGWVLSYFSQRIGEDRICQPGWITSVFDR